MFGWDYQVARNFSIMLKRKEFLAFVNTKLKLSKNESDLGRNSKTLLLKIDRQKINRKI